MTTATATGRKAELGKAIGEIERKQGEAKAALADLNSRLTNETATLAEKKRLHIRACRDESLIDPRDAKGATIRGQREMLEADVRACESRILGLNSLTAEATARVQQFSAQLQPLYDESNALAHAEDVARWKREEQDAFQRARQLLLTLFATQREFASAIGTLRGNYFEQDAGVRSAAMNHAAELEAALAGVRVQDIFSAAELKAIGIVL